MLDFSQPDRRKPRLNLAPLIDVVFLLLVFFMLASTFIEPQAIDLSLPASATSPPAASPLEPLVVSIDGDETIRLNGLHLGLDQLGTEILGRIDGDTSRQVSVRAESSVPVQMLVSVMDEISAAGLKNIRLSAPPAP